MKISKANGSFSKIHKGGKIEITVIIKSHVPLFKISESTVPKLSRKDNPHLTALLKAGTRLLIKIQTFLFLLYVYSLISY